MAKKKTITLEVRDEYILGSGVSIGAAGSYDSVILEVKFDDSWAGLNKYATWTNALGEMADQIIITPFNGVDGLEDTYYIPVTAPAAKYAGTVKLSFTGYALSRGEGDRTIESFINTASGSFRVLESNADPLDGAGTTPSVVQQLLEQLNATEQRLKAVEEGETERDKLYGEAEAERDKAFDAKEAERKAEFNASYAKIKAQYDALGVVQTPGNSETQVMSQKATTEAIGVVASAFDIHTSPNLLNMETTTLGIGMAANGNTYTSVAFLLSDYIPVSEGDVLTVQVKRQSTDESYISNMRWACAFNADKEVMPKAGSNDIIEEYTVPSGVSFVRITIGGWYEGMVAAIVKGTEILPYEPYGTFLTLKETSHNIDYIKEMVNEVNNGNIKPLALPPTTYGFVGYPITTYFYNIMGYNPNDVYMYFYGQNEGKKQYADRCEYIPTSAKTEYTRLYVYDHNYKQLNEHMYPMIIKDASVKDSLKVLVIGDSTVNAGKETQKMLDLAAADGYGLTFLGTRGTSPNLHEGRAGWRANIYATMSEALSAGVMTQNPFYNPTTSAFDFSYYMTQQGYNGVDCVFLQLGINDVFAAKDHEIEDAISAFISSMNALVNSIHEYDANIKIVVNLVIPCGTDQDAFTEYYNLSQTTWRCKKNTYMANIALLENFKGASNVYLSPYNAAIDTESNLRGDVHPIDTGYEQLGTQMYSFMRAIN